MLPVGNTQPFRTAIPRRQRGLPSGHGACLSSGMNRSTSPKIRLRRVLLTGVLAGGLAWLPACSVPVRAPEARAPEGLRVAGLGSAASAVFRHPEIEQYYAGVPMEALPEYSRSDRALALREPQPVTAIDQWPQPGIPDVTIRGRTFFGRSDREFIYFLPPEQRRRGGRGPVGGYHWVP